jgi:DeoR family suf operon transcriptional repressor
MQESRRLILDYLRDHAEAKVEELADAIGLAPVTVRHHLGILRERGLIEFGTESVGRGRPRHLYRLSDRAGEAFLEGRQYIDLLTGVLEAVARDDADEPARILRGIGTQIADDNEHRYAGRAPEERMGVLTDLFHERGFTARWERDGDGFLFHTITCAYGDLAASHRSICLIDQEIIRRVGGGNVSRVTWRRDPGTCCCTYRIALRTNGSEPSS